MEHRRRRGSRASEPTNQLRILGGAEKVNSIPFEVPSIVKGARVSEIARLAEPGGNLDPLTEQEPGLAGGIPDRKPNSPGRRLPATLRPDLLDLDQGLLAVPDRYGVVEDPASEEDRIARGHELANLRGGYEGRGGVPTVMKILRQNSYGAPEEDHCPAAHPEGPGRRVDAEGETTPGPQQASGRETQNRKEKAGARQTRTDDPGRKGDRGAENSTGEGGTVSEQATRSGKGPALRPHSG